jgi:uncharacterized protein YndB with AHSA1/START domain
MNTRRSLEIIAEPGEPTIVMKRLFDAPARFVFDAHTRPEHLMRWWGGCKEMTMTVCEVDLRVGGAYRFVVRMPGGPDLGFRGVYREITPPLRLVNTSVFEMFPDHEAVITLSLEERDGQTMLTSTTLHASVAARDGHLASGMEKGANDGLDRLADLLASMVSTGQSAQGGLSESLAR